MEKENPLVSIITPCYNGENVMHRLLDSILSQTYSNIEFILINDGSTDHSEEIWYQYEKKFNEKGIKTIYIHQRNQGLGAAINAGLKVFTGDYLCWPDIDDYFEREVIPYNQQAWIDKSKTKVGYEIPFTRTFYEYKQIEPSDVIAARIEEHEKSLMAKLHDLFGGE